MKLLYGTLITLSLLATTTISAESSLKKPHKPHSTHAILSTIAQLAHGLAQASDKENSQAMQQALQTILTAALNLSALSKEYGLTGNESPEIIAATLIEQLDASEQRYLAEEILRITRTIKS